MNAETTIRDIAGVATNLPRPNAYAAHGVTGAGRRYCMDGDRELGPEMMAEGWIVLGGDDLLWPHPMSRRCVSVSGNYERGEVDVPTWTDKPIARTTLGYVVSCEVHDEDGNPTREGAGIWFESYGSAVRLARRLRQAILDEKPVPPDVVQLSLLEKP